MDVLFRIKHYMRGQDISERAQRPSVDTSAARLGVRGFGLTRSGRVF